MRAARRHSGFTLVEVVMVLSIIAVVTAIALPRYGRSMSRYRTMLAARRVVADLAFARNHARQTSQSVTVNIQVANSRLWMPGVDGLRVAGENYQTLFNDEPYQVSLANSNFGGDDVVIFNGYGVPDSGGSVDVQAGSISITVTLDPDTGKASMP